MKEQFGDLDVVIAPVGLVIGSHCGLVRLVLFSIVLKNNLKITKNAFRGVFCCIRTIYGAYLMV